MTKNSLVQKLTVLLLAVFPLLYSCSDYQQVLKGSNYDDKWNTALKLYENKQYNRALPLFEELLTVYRVVRPKPSNFTFTTPTHTLASKITNRPNTSSTISSLRFPTAGSAKKRRSW